MLHDIRWHDANSHMLGFYIFKGTEQEALTWAIGRFSIEAVRTVRILRGSRFTFTLTRDN